MPQVPNMPRKSQSSPIYTALREKGKDVHFLTFKLLVFLAVFSKTKKKALMRII